MLGLGRAVLFVDGPLAPPFSEAVLEACLQNKARDPQIEDSREQYMLDIVRRTGNPSFYTDHILAVPAVDPDSWDVGQRLEMLRLLAQEGDSQARCAMIATFEATFGPSNGGSFASEFIELDGIAGLLFVMERIGAWLREDEERWVDDMLLSLAGGMFGTDAVSSAVSERARIDVNVAAFLERANATSVEWTDDSRVLSYEQVRIHIRSGRSGYFDWVKRAGPVELEFAALDLIHETECDQLLAYLKIFRNRRFPLDCEHLIRLTASPDGGVARRALLALANVENDKVRQLALSLVESRSPHRIFAIDLLVNNFRSGDQERVANWCKEETEPDFINGYGLDLGEFFRAHPSDKIETELLVALYDRQPCSHCRHNIVQRLIELNALPDDLRAESKFDSYLETRELVAG